MGNQPTTTNNDCDISHEDDTHETTTTTIAIRPTRTNTNRISITTHQPHQNAPPHPLDLPPHPPRPLQSHLPLLPLSAGIPPPKRARRPTSRSRRRHSRDDPRALPIPYLHHSRKSVYC